MAYLPIAPSAVAQPCTAFDSRRSAWKQILTLLWQLRALQVLSRAKHRRKIAQRIILNPDVLLAGLSGCRAQQFYWARECCYRNGNPDRQPAAGRTAEGG